MHYRIIKYTDLLSSALLNLLNEEDLPINSKGKYFIKLTYKNKQKLAYHIQSSLKNNVFFGKQTIVLGTCKFETNWRKEIDNLEGTKYKLLDDSVYMDNTIAEKYFNKEYQLLKKKNDKCIFIDMEEVDSIDLLYAINHYLGLNCGFGDGDYKIMEDGNILYPRDNYIPNYIIGEIETQMRSLNLLI